MNANDFFQQLYVFKMTTSMDNFYTIFKDDDGHLWESLISDCRWDVLKFFDRLDIDNQKILENHIDNKVKRSKRIKKLKNILNR